MSSSVIPGSSNNGARRVALVTGVGKAGLGEGFATRFAELGMAVMMADLDPVVAEVAASFATRYNDTERFAHYVGDLSVEANVAAMVDATVARFGRIDVLVNNAGRGVILPFLEHTAETLQTTFNRNLWTTLWCCHKVLPHMVRQNHGRIVNIGADSLRTGIPNHAGYNAAKGGVIGLMVGLAKEFARHDITVNTVSPCVVNGVHFRERLLSDPKLAADFVQVVPKGRGVEIDEVVDVVAFLARPEAAFITGQDISVNGGSAMP